MHWKIAARVIGIFGSLCVASAVMVYKIIKAGLEPEPYEKKEPSQNGEVKK